MTKLTSDAVRTIMLKVLYTPEEAPPNQPPPQNAVMVEGIVHQFGFHPERLKAAKPEIDALLTELPEQFQHDKGGGWSFLNACVDKDENQWGEHPDMKALICLGIGVGSAAWMLKEMASALPGGMPYVRVSIKPETLQ